VLHKPCTVRIIKQCAKQTERTYALEPDVRSVGRVLVLDSTRVVAWSDDSLECTR
jgi:hypothetical protein